MAEAIVDVRVAKLLPFLVLEALAVRHREKNEDAVDIVWLLTNWCDGPEGAAADAHSSPIADDPDVHEGLLYSVL